MNIYGNLFTNDYQYRTFDNNKILTTSPSLAYPSHVVYDNKNCKDTFIVSDQGHSFLKWINRNSQTSHRFPTGNRTFPSSLGLQPFTHNIGFIRQEFNTKSRIQVYNPGTKSLLYQIQSKEYDFVDMCFQDNGNLVAIDSNNLLLFDPSGRFLHPCNHLHVFNKELRALTNDRTQGILIMDNYNLYRFDTRFQTRPFLITCVGYGNESLCVDMNQYLHYSFTKGRVGVKIHDMRKLKPPSQINKRNAPNKPIQFLTDNYFPPCLQLRGLCVDDQNVLAVVDEHNHHIRLAETV